MNCPQCGQECRLLILGYDEYGAVRQWCCLDENCMWMEGDQTEEDKHQL